MEDLVNFFSISLLTMGYSRKKITPYVDDVRFSVRGGDPSRNQENPGRSVKKDNNPRGTCKSVKNSEGSLKNKRNFQGI